MTTPIPDMPLGERSGERHSEQHGDSASPMRSRNHPHAPRLADPSAACPARRPTVMSSRSAGTPGHRDRPAAASSSGEPARLSSHRQSSWIRPQGARLLRGFFCRSHAFLSASLRPGNENGEPLDS
jgi:hypothetical protein